MIKDEPLAADRAPPTVLPASTIHAMLQRLDGLWRVIAETIYLAGLRPTEAVRLRYRDVDLNGYLLRIVDEQGETDRVLRMPRRLRDALTPLQAAVEALYRWDRACGCGSASVPLNAYLKTNDAHARLAWQYYFPHYDRFPNGPDGGEYRHHVELYRFEEELRRVAALCGVRAKVTGYTLRHTRAVKLLRHGHPPERVQAILGQRDPALVERYQACLPAHRAA